MTGKEKVVLYLYGDACDGKNAAQTDSFSVGAATIGVVPVGYRALDHDRNGGRKISRAAFRDQVRTGRDRVLNLSGCGT